MGLTAREALKNFRVGPSNLYLLGSFESGVTVVSQQKRALNLAWALIESGEVPTIRSGANKEIRIAIVGGGFAGTTLAAALMRKGCAAKVTLFEKLDTLLPLQHGSDSRWLHPQIYDWPMLNSETSSAYLPLMNWTAARASDVVVECSHEWAAEVRRYRGEARKDPRIFCNTQHLQISKVPGSLLAIEWVGEPRDPVEPINPLENDGLPVGLRENFEIVVLAVGFGLEKNDAHSYWRNETFSQPNLAAPRISFIVSGQGDGALIDLLRLRISEFRQDRILSELFAEQDELVWKLKNLAKRQTNLFDELELIFSLHSPSTQNVLEALRKRLRHDTHVILHTVEKRLSDVFGKVKTSFQNRLLVYLLYRCGGFSPSTASVESLRKMFGVTEDNVIVRHGPDKVSIFRDTLSKQLFKSVFVVTLSHDGEERIRLRRPMPQPAEVWWQGGFFGGIGTIREAALLQDDKRQTWRKEYLPSTTRLLTASFCAAVAGLLAAEHPLDRRLRVTFHRALLIGDERLLQQTCDYVGLSLTKKEQDTFGRTFPAQNGTIGLAWRSGCIVRSKRRTRKSTLKEAMTTLKLNVASREMSGNVGFVLAVPFLSYTTKGKAYVIGVLYIDSEANGYVVDDKQLSALIRMGQKFLETCAELSTKSLSKVANYPCRLSELAKTTGTAKPNVVELLSQLSAPAVFDVASPSVINFEQSDFAPISQHE